MSLPIYRNSRIDLLRGIGILLVLIHHFHIAYPLDNNIYSLNFINNGYYGVTMLFVASGFLITTKSIARYATLGNINIFLFYSQRIARIMPCLLLVLALITIFNFAQIHIFRNDNTSTSFLLAIFSVLTFWHNILMAQTGWFNYCLNVFWSLSVTEVFYLSFPLLCLLLKSHKRIIALLLLFIMTAPLYRCIYSNNEIISMCGNISCLDAISIGCLAAILAPKLKLNSLTRTSTTILATLIITFIYFYSTIMNSIVFGVFFVALATAMLLISPTTATTCKSRSESSITIFLCWLGKNCYEIYLFHIIILAGMKETLPNIYLNEYTKILWLLIFFLLTILTAHCVATYFSYPLNNKIRRLFTTNHKQTMTLVKSTSLLL